MILAIGGLIWLREVITQETNLTILTTSAYVATIWPSFTNDNIAANLQYLHLEFLHIRSDI